MSSLLFRSFGFGVRAFIPEFDRFGTRGDSTAVADSAATKLDEKADLPLIADCSLGRAYLS